MKNNSEDFRATSAESVAAQHTSAKFQDELYAPARPAPKDPLYPGPIPLPRPTPRPPKPFGPDEFNQTPQLELDSIQKFLDSFKTPDSKDPPPKKDRIAEDEAKKEKK